MASFGGNQGGFCDGLTISRGGSLHNGRGGRGGGRKGRSGWSGHSNHSKQKCSYCGSMRRTNEYSRNEQGRPFHANQGTRSSSNSSVDMLGSLSYYSIIHPLPQRLLLPWLIQEILPSWLVNLLLHGLSTLGPVPTCLVYQLFSLISILYSLVLC